MIMINIFYYSRIFKLRAENFGARVAQTNFASKNDIVNFIKKTDFYNKSKI